MDTMRRINNTNIPLGKERAGAITKQTKQMAINAIKKELPVIFAVRFKQGVKPDDVIDMLDKENNNGMSILSSRLVGLVNQ